ncbi:hypothetical protein KIW84_062530 [Lathyrus oleraceus]|uniref:Uncharacterized protein n=1 Tax=Pisum sativum TaxID=3888 RepID=A0A9D4W641_PEA|nr:hypothetical protein KIW84_062530 [Pisum sativum]
MAEVKDTATMDFRESLVGLGVTMKVKRRMWVWFVGVLMNGEVSGLKVYYVPYPSIQPRKGGWSDVMEDVPYQDDETSLVNEIIEIEEITSLCDTAVEGQ